MTAEAAAIEAPVGEVEQSRKPELSMVQKLENFLREQAIFRNITDAVKFLIAAGLTTIEVNFQFAYLPEPPKTPHPLTINDNGQIRLSNRAAHLIAIAHTPASLKNLLDECRSFTDLIDIKQLPAEVAEPPAGIKDVSVKTSGSIAVAVPEIDII